jgi:hypothetical protein
MIEIGILVAGFLILGGILKFMCGNGAVYSEEYYKYLKNNQEKMKKVPGFKDNNLYL